MKNKTKTGEWILYWILVALTCLGLTMSCTPDPLWVDHSEFLNCVNEASSCFKANGALTLRFGNLLTGSNVGNYLLGVGYPSMEAIEKTYDELLAHDSYKELMTFAKVNMRNIIKIL